MMPAYSYDLAGAFRGGSRAVAAVGLTVVVGAWARQNGRRGFISARPWIACAGAATSMLATGTGSGRVSARGLILRPGGGRSSSRISVRRHPTAWLPDRAKALAADQLTSRFLARTMHRPRRWGERTRREGHRLVDENAPLRATTWMGTRRARRRSGRVREADLICGAVSCTT